MRTAGSDAPTKRLDGGELRGRMYDIDGNGQSVCNTFDAGTPDEHRKTFEAFGRRVAMHLERRDVKQAMRVLSEASRFIHELDNPEQVAAVDLPVAAVIGDVRICNMLEENAGVVFVRDLIGKTPESLLQIANCGSSAVAQIRASLDRIGVRWHAAETNSTQGKSRAAIAKQSRAAKVELSKREYIRRQRFVTLKNLLRRSPKSLSFLYTRLGWSRKSILQLLESGHFAKVESDGVERWKLIRE